MSAPIVESPRVPEMNRDHVATIQDLINDGWPTRIEEVRFREVEKVIQALASGRLQTYSPESEVRISREALEYYATFCRECATMANQWERPQQANQFERVHDAIRGWLVSTTQEVSE